MNNIYLKGTKATYNGISMNVEGLTLMAIAIQFMTYIIKTSESQFVTVCIVSDNLIGDIFFDVSVKNFTVLQITLV